MYVAEVACKKAAAANVETVFSGAGKFTDEVSSNPMLAIAPAPLSPPTLCSQMVPKVKNS